MIDAMRLGPLLPQAISSRARAALSAPQLAYTERPLVSAPRATASNGARGFAASGIIKAGKKQSSRQTRKYAFINHPHAAKIRAAKLGISLVELLDSFRRPAKNALLRRPWPTCPTRQRFAALKRTEADGVLEVQMKKHSRAVSAESL